MKRLRWPNLFICALVMFLNPVFRQKRYNRFLWSPHQSMVELRENVIFFFWSRYKNVWDIRYPRVSKLLIFFVKLLFETCRYLKRCYTYKKINNVLPSHHLINLLTMFRTHTLNLFHYILSLLQKFLTLCVFNFKSVLKIQERDMTDFIYISLITITYDGEKKNFASCRRVWEGGRNLSQSHGALLST